MRPDTPGPVGERAAALFREHFRYEPEVLASAPGRVNLIGEHTDYNGGHVLPIAIDRRTYAAMGVRAGGSELRAASTAHAGVGTSSLDNGIRSGEWHDYALGVIAAILKKNAAPSTGNPLSVDIAISSDVPEGAGLSSSAALEVATATALMHRLALPPNAREAALISWGAETSFVGVECGIMDQFASALARSECALHIDCATLQTDYAPFLESVLIVDSGVRRSLRQSQFNQRRAECVEALALLRARWPELENLASATVAQVEDARLPAPLDRRALHVVTETRRVIRAVEMLKTDGRIAGSLLLESHASARDLYECSTPELDWIVAHASRIDGVQGARLTGAGWGGCAIVVGDGAALHAVRDELGEPYQTTFGTAARFWLSGAASGARIE